jgi:hypothetical protein
VVRCLYQWQRIWCIGGFRATVQTVIEGCWIEIQPLAPGRFTKQRSHLPFMFSFRSLLPFKPFPNPPPLQTIPQSQNRAGRSPIVAAVALGAAAPAAVGHGGGGPHPPRGLILPPPSRRAPIPPWPRRRAPIVCKEAGTATTAAAGASTTVATLSQANQSFTPYGTMRAAVFKYSAAAHDVVEVSRSGYRSCSAESPKSTFRTGNDAVQLDGVRVRYFICAVPGHWPPG